MALAAPRAMIHRGYHGAVGTQYKNSLQLVRSVACVNGLLGNFNQRGGLYPGPKVKLGKLDPEKFPAPEKLSGPMIDGSEDPERYPLTPVGHGLAHAIPELAIEGKLKAGFVYHNNPLRTNPNPARVIEGYRKLDLLVSFDYVLFGDRFHCRTTFFRNPTIWSGTMWCTPIIRTAVNRLR